MTMSNKLYDILKGIAMVVIPALATLYLTLASIWGWSNAEQIVATLTAINTFLGVVLGLSSNKYKKSQS